LRRRGIKAEKIGPVVGFGQRRISGRQRHAVFLGQALQGLAESKALLLHDEGKDVAAGGAGAEAVPGLGLRIDEETAEALQGFA